MEGEKWKIPPLKGQACYQNIHQIMAQAMKMISKKSAMVLRVRGPSGLLNIMRWFGAC